jgi:hypothetical protein
MKLHMLQSFVECSRSGVLLQLLAGWSAVLVDTWICCHSPTMVPAGTVYLPICVTLVVILQQQQQHIPLTV